MRDDEAGLRQEMGKERTVAQIVIFGGTNEGRRLAEAFAGTSLTLHVCVATEYGAELTPEAKNIHIHEGRLNEAEMEDFLAGLSPDCCVDATHPYACQVTENIRTACRNLGIFCIRILREKEQEPEEGAEVVHVGSPREAAIYLRETKGRILLTTGSRDLEAFTALPDYEKRCFARVLPVPQVLEKCRSLGLEGEHVIAMQGPFGEDMNYWMLRHVGASWMVTKDSGKEGGFLEKLRAAARAGAVAVVIDRPAEDGRSPGDDGFLKGGRLPEDGRPPEDDGRTAMGLSGTIAWLRRRYAIPGKRKLFLIGAGPGGMDLMTQEAVRALRQADVLIGAKRVLEICRQAVGELDYLEEGGGRRGPGKPCLEAWQPEKIVRWLEAHEEYQSCALVFSGDIGFYSGAERIGSLFEGYELHRVCGVASVVCFLDRMGLGWDQVRLGSMHGREWNLLPALRYEKRVCLLLRSGKDLPSLCRLLLEYDMADIKITVGENISYPQERILSGTPKSLLEETFEPLCMALFENPRPMERPTLGMEDEAFLRDRVPMTKKEIRILSLAALGLRPDSVLYDIGAGTGSVSVEAALQCMEGRVYAVERKEEAVSLIRQNAGRFGCANLQVIPGEAPQGLEGLPAPTHVFIGGSGGRLKEILQAVRERAGRVRIVVNALTLETLAELMEITKDEAYEDVQVLQVNAAKSRRAGRYHMMCAENPVAVVSFWTGKEG